MCRLLFNSYAMFTAPKGKTRISHTSSCTHKVSQYLDVANINGLVSVSQSIVGD